MSSEAPGVALLAGDAEGGKRGGGGGWGGVIYRLYLNGKDPASQWSAGGQIKKCLRFMIWG